jgi:hypothetical protein
MIARLLLVAALALLLAAQVVRNAVVAAFVSARPQDAARMWPDHPDVALAQGMIEIARSARAGKPVPTAVLDAMYREARGAPLDPEPYLVRGVQAQLAGDEGTAKQAFLAAQRRDPRSLPAAYFLADDYFRAGDAQHGLNQIALVSRLSPSGSVTVAPYVAAYARDPANWAAVRRIFRSDPELQTETLVQLAQKPENAAAVLALANPQDAAQVSNWLPVLIDALDSAGQYARARAIWARVSNARLEPGALLYDRSFRDGTTPPPFNWSFSSSTAGLAERQPGGRLHLLFYGQQDGVLARQLLLMPPGTYRLTMQLLGDRARAHALSWNVRCDKASQPAATTTLDSAARGWIFRVPAGCPAQWLEISGSSSDMPQQSDVTIAGLNIVREAPGA